MDKILKLITFNCKCVATSVDCIRRLCVSADLIALQETWLLPHDLSFLGSIHDDFAYTGTSAVDTSSGILRGRPFGGVALLWRKSVFTTVSVVKCNSPRLAAIKVQLFDRQMLVFSVYMPTNCNDNLTEFTSCLSQVNSIIDSNNIQTAFILGDFNAHVNELFYKELIDFCDEQRWICADIELLPPDSYTFVSDAHRCKRWLDHCVVTESARSSLINVQVLSDTYWSDHLPMRIECELSLINANICLNNNIRCDNVLWGERDLCQIVNYTELCQNELQKIDLPTELTQCVNKICNNQGHRAIIDSMYEEIINLIREASKKNYKCFK